MSELRVHLRSRPSGYDFVWWHEGIGEGQRLAPAVLRAQVVLDEPGREALRSGIDLAAQAIGRLPGALAGDEALRRLGALVHGRLLPPALVATLADLSPGTPIVWASDESDLPWELAYDGRHFLSIRHPFSRILISAEPLRHVPATSRRASAVLIVANPNGDLPRADVEAEALLDAYDVAGGVRCDLLARDHASSSRVLEACAGGRHAVIHFAGHARPGALRLADGWIAAETLAEALRGEPTIVLNACSSARAPEADGRAPSPRSIGVPGAPSGLVGALLRAGAAGVVGQMWPLFDARAARFGPLLHRRLLAGDTLAVAVQRARAEARDLAPDDAAWAAPALWSDSAMRPLPPRPRRQPGSVVIVRLSDPDPEGPRSIVPLRDALAAAVGAIRQRGGHVLSRDERGLRAVFGLPRTLEDDAARALVASLSVRAALAPWSLGIGVASGELEIDDGALDGAGPLVCGPVVERARGLAWAAANALRSTIFVSAEAVRLAGTAFHFAAIEDGPGLIADDRMLLERSSASSLDEPVRPIEGRAAELGALAGYWGSARAGRGCVVGIVGEAGVGKSHLLAAFRASLSEVAHHWLMVRPAAGGEAPYAVIGRLLGALLATGRDEGVIRDEARRGVVEAGDGRRIARALAEALPTLEVSSRLLALVAEVCGTQEGGATPSEPDEARGLLVDLLRRLLARQASGAPLVLALEDLHRVDEVSLDVLSRVTDGVGELPILVLGLTRVGSRSEATPWSHSPDYRHLALAPLSEGAQRSLLARWLETDPDALPLTLETLLARTGGNPLFLEECLRALREQGRLVRSDGRWRLEGSIGPARAPESLRRVMLARFDRLSGDTRRVLDAAAVMGDPVEPERLAEVVGQAVDEAVRELEARGFLRARWESGTYRFHHDLVRETAAAALEPVRRQALHRRVARALEGGFDVAATSAAIEANLLERLARHWHMALADPETGAPVDGVQEQDLIRALRRLLAAGRLALRRLAARAALRHFDAATRLMAPGLPAGIEAGVARSLASEAYAGAGEAHARLGAFDAAIERYERAVALAADDPDASRGRVADLARRLGRLHAWGGRPEEALAWLDRGQGLLAEGIRDDERGVAAQLHVQRGVVHYWHGQMDEALAQVQRGLGIAEGTDHREALATGYNVLGAVTDARGERAAAEGAYERSLTLWRALGDDYQAARVADNLGVTYFHRGRWADAAAAHERALAFLERIEDHDQAAYARINLANVTLGRGGWDEADALLRTAESDARRVGNRRIEALASLNRGLTALERMDGPAAERHLAAAGSIIESQELEDMASELRVARGRLALLAGEPAEAEAHARGALELARTHALQLEEALARRLLGSALADRGARQEALAHVEWSCRVLEELEHRHELGRTLVILAGVLSAGGDEASQEAARERLARAREIFDTLGATADQMALETRRSGAA